MTGNSTLAAAAAAAQVGSTMKFLATLSRKAAITATVVGLALTAVVVTAGSASASTVPRPKITSNLTKFDSLQTPKKARALCPVGTRVIGGGGRVNGGQHVIITQQQPVHGTQDAFVVRAIEDQIGTTQSWAVQAFAICSVPLPGLEIITATGPAGSSGFQGQNADCSPGKNVLGVGGRINNGSNEVTLNTQGLFPQRASASGFEDSDGFSGNWSVTAFAICAKLNSVFDSAIVSVQTAADTTARKITSATCPPGMSVTGGGAFAEFPGVVEVVSPDTSSVQVIARQDGVVTPADRWAVTAYAFCAL